jgi:hypothetical protein
MSDHDDRTGPEGLWDRIERRAFLQRHYFNKRSHHRIDFFEPVQLDMGRSAIAAELIDLSAGGVRLRVCNGLVPLAGEEVTVRLVDDKFLWGTVAWTTDDTVGIALPAPLPDLDDLLWPEGRGLDYLKRLVSR